MAVKQWLFNNAYSMPAAGGLGFALTRAYGSVAPNGIPSQQNMARYWLHQRLLCSPPDATTESAAPYTTASFHSPLAGGFAADGVSPLLLYKNADQNRVTIFKSTISNSISSVVHDKTLQRTQPGGIYSDLLVGQPNADPNHAHTFMAGAVCHGLVLALCKKRDFSQPPIAANSLATSAFYWQESHANSGTGGWLPVGEGPQTAQTSQDRGSFFQLQGWRCFQNTTPTVAWFAFSNYMTNPGSLSGDYYVIKATRTSVSAPWTVGTLMLVLALPAITNPIDSAYRHAHTPYIERNGANGLRLICPVGDSWGNNQVIELQRSDENYTQGQASNQDATANGWTTRTQRHGTFVNAITTLPTGDANQFIGSAAIGAPDNPLGSVVGGDEMAVSIAKLGPAGDIDNRHNYLRLYGPGAASANRFNAGATLPNFFGAKFAFNCFTINARTHLPAGPFVAFVGPGSHDQGTSTSGFNVGWVTQHGVSRILYSPDGEHWGQCWAPNFAALQPVMFFGDRIVLGSPGSPARGLRSISIPACTVQRPLAVGAGAKNLLVATPSVGNIGANNAVTDVTGGLPAGVPPPPCLGRVYRCKVSDQSGTDKRIGVWKLTGNGAVSPGIIRLRVWVYPMPWSGANQPHANNWQVVCGAGRWGLVDDPPVPDVRNSRETIITEPHQVVGDSVRGWIPVTLDTNSNNWYSDSNAPAAPSSPFALGLRLLSGFGLQPPNPSDFLVAYDYVVDSDTKHPGVPLPVDSSVVRPPEVAKITNFACGTSWTVHLAGEVPEDSWDQTEAFQPGYTTGGVLFTLYDSGASRWLEVAADPAQKKLVIRWYNSVAVNLFAASGDEFFFLRGSPVFVSIGYNPSTGYVIAASIGGTRVATLSGVQGPALSPSEVRYCDNAMQSVLPMLWYGGTIDTSQSASAAEMKTTQQTLGMLYQLTLPITPGGLPT